MAMESTHSPQSPDYDALRIDEQWKTPIVSLDARKHERAVRRDSSQEDLGNNQNATSTYSVDSPHSYASSDSPRSSVQSPPTPMPHTPMFSPPSHGDDSHDLPNSLVQIGWRKFFSHRENRPYYFNKLTQKTQWDMPNELEDRRKRHHGQDEPVINNKRFIPCSDWNLSVPTNIRMQEVIPSAFYPPHPDIEILRAETFAKMRKTFAEMCSAKDLDFPVDCLCEWLLERCCNNKAREQFFPSLFDDPQPSPSLIRDLENSVPIHFDPTKTGTVQDARKLLGRYAERARALVDSHCIRDGRKQIKWHCNDTFDWLRRKDNNTLEENMNRLFFLREQCASALMAALKTEIEKLVRRLEAVSEEHAKSVQDRHKALMQASHIDLREPRLPPPRDRSVPCYSCQLRFAPPRQPIVYMEQTEDGWAKLKYKDISIRIAATHFFKLEQLYRHNCFDDKRFDLYLVRVWTMIRRYQCLYGSDMQHAIVNHRSLPVPLSEVLHQELGVTFEAFASPLNCFFRQFCSLFPDTDGYFGSRGSFLRFQPREGSISVTLPPSQYVIAAVLKHVIELLHKAERDHPLSFVVFMPHLGRATEEIVSEIEASVYRKGPKMVFKSDRHIYRLGAQHLILTSKAQTEPSLLDTLVYVLQNDAAFAKWTPTDEIFGKIRSAFKDPLAIDTDNTGAADNTDKVN